MLFGSGHCDGLTYFASGFVASKRNAGVVYSPILRTRRPVTYTVNVDWIPPRQPGLKFPPHAVRLASPHAGSCGSQAVTRYRQRLSRARSEERTSELQSRGQ